LFSGNTTSVGLTTSVNSAVDFVGVDHTDPDILYARVTLENGTTIGDALYKINASTGTTWTLMLRKADGLTFLARGNGDLVAATQTLGAFKSINQGAGWTNLATAPHINCLAENSAGEVWACTQNYGNPPAVPSDGFGIMKSTDLSTWTGVLKFQDIAGPVACAAGTAQQDMCVGDPVTGVWCTLRQQLGITASPVNCAVAEAMPDGTSGKSKGCCDSSSGGGAAAGGLASLVAGTLLFRRRRPKRG
jgi:MYXO-CTERM domain-containing protein